MGRSYSRHLSINCLTAWMWSIVEYRLRNPASSVGWYSSMGRVILLQSILAKQLLDLWEEAYWAVVLQLAFIADFDCCFLPAFGDIHSYSILDCGLSMCGQPTCSISTHIPCSPDALPRFIWLRAKPTSSSNTWGKLSSSRRSTGSALGSSASGSSGSFIFDA